MSDHPIESMMNTTMEKIKTMVDASTMIGDPITTPDGTVIIPVSKVSFGFASGGSDLPTTKQGDLFGGGAGGGVSVQPLAFLVIKDGHVELLQINDNKNTADRVVAMVPEMVDKLGVLFTKKDKKDGESAKAKPAPAPDPLDDIPGL